MIIMNLGTTFVMVTHDTEIANSCDRIIELKDGKVISDRNVKSTESSAEEE